MGLFDFFTNRKVGRSAGRPGSYVNVAINDTDLTALTHSVISLFEANPGYDHIQLIDLIKTYHPSEDLAMALYRFIPMAYCRLFIPEPAYSDEYVVYKSTSNQTTYRLSEDQIYAIVLAISNERLNQAASSDAVLSILYHSADFKAINDALKNGSDLKNLVCSPSYFL